MSARARASGGLGFGRIIGFHYRSVTPIEIKSTMSWWRILHQIANNEQLIQKLADSMPIRRLARFIASTYYANYDKFSDVIQRLTRDQSLHKRLDQFSNKFKQELKKEFEKEKSKFRDK